MKSLFFLLAGLTVCGGPAAAQPGAALMRKGAATFENAPASPPALAEGSVVAAAGEETRVRLFDGSELRLEPGGRVELGPQNPGLMLIRVTAGKVWAKVVKLQGRRFELRSPNAVAAVRGTEFSMSVLGPDASVTEVVEGRVSVRALLEDKPVGAERWVGAGQSVRVSGGAVGPIEALQGMNDPRSRPLRATLAREVGLQLGAEAVQRAAAGSTWTPNASEAGARMGALSQLPAPVVGGGSGGGETLLGTAPSLLTNDQTPSSGGGLLTPLAPAYPETCLTCPLLK